MTRTHVHGYASVFNVLDAHGDRVVPQAFQGFLQYLYRTQRYPPILYEHDPAHIIGQWTHMHTDEHGLWVEGVLTHPFLRRETAGLSMGYTHDTASYTDDARLLRAIVVWEVSLVERPANPLTYAEFS